MYEKLIYSVKFLTLNAYILDTKIELRLQYLRDRKMIETNNCKTNTCFTLPRI